MQSFKLHIVSEHLKDRHPYLELDFNDRYDPSEVYLAVFDRAIPKLVEILQMENISPEKHRDALITLNEMSSHQENKDMMISHGLVKITSRYMQSQTAEIRRESVLLLGSLLSVLTGRESVGSNAQTFSGLEKMLFDSVLTNREACGWCLNRISSGRDGVEILCQSSLVEKMIASFMNFTEKLDILNGPFLIYLMESFIAIFQYDNGIKFFLGSGMMARLNSILTNKANQEFNLHFAHRIHPLALDILAKCTVNMKGKEEAIQEKIIETANEFLLSQNLEECHNSVVLIMNCTIHLEGKKQAVFYRKNELIHKLINLVEKSTDEDLRVNIKQALVNIADLPEGFHVIAKILCKNIKILEEIFGAQSAKALVELLPKTSSLEFPPIVPDEIMKDNKNVCIALCVLIKNHDESVRIVVEETVKVVERIVPYLILRNEKSLQDQVANCLYKICHYDEYSREILGRFLIEFGNVNHSGYNTTLNFEIQKYNKLLELIDEKRYEY